MRIIINIDQIVQEVHQLLKQSGNAQRGIMQKKYLKSPFRFYGVSRPEMQRIGKSIKKKYAKLDQEELLDMCSRLWESDYHESKSVSIDLLNLYRKQLDHKSLDFIDHMIDTATGWDHIDEIAVRLIGHLLMTDKQHFDYLKICAQSENFWKRRVSIIAQLKLFKTENCDKELFFTLCSEHLYEKEFFIRKAIGWGLRELSKSDPHAVYEFIVQNKAHMSGLTFREGSRRLPANLRKKLE